MGQLSLVLWHTVCGLWWRNIFFSPVLGMETRATCLLGKPFELHPQPYSLSNLPEFDFSLQINEFSVTSRARMCLLGRSVTSSHILTVGFLNLGS